MDVNTITKSIYFLETYMIYDIVHLRTSLGAYTYAGFMWYVYTYIRTYIFVGLILMLWHRETNIYQQRNRYIIVHPVGIELTTSRLRQLRSCQLSSTYASRHWNFVKTQLLLHARGCIGQRYSNRKETSCLPLLNAGFEPEVSDTESSADWMPADKRTELSRIKLKNLNSTTRPYDERAFSPLDPTHSTLAFAPGSGDIHVCCC